MEIWFFITGYLIHFFASCILIWKIRSTQSIYGLSPDTQICYLLATVSRWLWALDTRLVETNLAYLELFLSLGTAVVLTFLVIKYRHTTTKKPAKCLRVIPLSVVSLLLAFWFHPGHNWWTVQILVAFTMYIEAAALLPQLYLMRRMIEIEPLTSHYVALLTVSRFVRMLFWLQLYNQGEHFVGLFLSDLLHTLFSMDYLYMWVKKLRNGGTLIYRL